MQQIVLSILLVNFGLALAQQCPDLGLNFTCPHDGFDFCAVSSLSSNIIIRCTNGCPVPGNCNDNLAGVPPVGVKSAALCWQDSPTAGDAQCTFDCVNVTTANGTVFYPVGCTLNTANTTTVSPSGATSTSIRARNSTSSSAAGSATAAATTNAATSSSVTTSPIASHTSSANGASSWTGRLEMAGTVSLAGLLLCLGSLLAL